MYVYMHLYIYIQYMYKGRGYPAATVVAPNPKVYR